MCARKGWATLEAKAAPAALFQRKSAGHPRYGLKAEPPALNEPLIRDTRKDRLRILAPQVFSILPTATSPCLMELLVGTSRFEFWRGTEQTFGNGEDHRSVKTRVRDDDGTKCLLTIYRITI